MQLTRHPELLDRIAGAYALGTLRGGARRRFEAMARQNPVVRASALVWQERFASLTELQPGEAPGPNVWKRIENLVRSDAQPARAAQEPGLLEGLRQRLGWWRMGTLAGALVAGLVAVVAVDLGSELRQRDSQLAQLQAKPQIEYVAVLSGDKDASQVLVTFDPRQNRLTLKRVGAFDRTPDKALELWALQPGGAAPRSLGMFGADQVVRLQAAETQLREVPGLAITLEPSTKPPGLPAQGPILWKGSLLQTGV